MNIRLVYLLTILISCNACSTTAINTSPINDEIAHGESLYSINKNISEKNAEQAISSSIFSQELLSWKQKFIERYGSNEWMKFREQVIKKYGYTDKMRWFLD